MFQSILLPIHSTRADTQRTQTAINFSRNKISHLIILSVTESKSPSLHASQAINYALTIVKDLIIKDDGVCDVLYRQGKPEFVICKIAEELKVDLIVMGAKGVDLLQDSKSTISKVLQDASCPVLIVP
mgnify:CR=1 FL=1